MSSRMLSSKTILLVENDPDVAAALLEALTEAGHGVVGPYRSAGAAEAGAALNRLDAAIIDADHVAGDGGAAVDLAQTLIRRWGVSVILLTKAVDLAAPTTLAGVRTLVKPFSILKLLGAVEGSSKPDAA
ncbi:MAG: hypothetical protein ACK4OJ_06740 [Brevundimonas sp.]